MDFESCNSAAQFAIPQSQNTFVIPNATPFIEFGLNMLATGHVGPTIRIFDVTQPLSFAVFNRVHSSRANLSPQQEEQATLLSCQLAFLREASKNQVFKHIRIRPEQ